MKTLNFPEFDFSMKKEGQKTLIFDRIRKKFIPLTREEWVRQHVLHYLTECKNIHPSKIAVERELKFNGLKKRFDVLVFKSGAVPHCIVECKAPEIVLTSQTVLQAAVYNTKFSCEWLWITNGVQNFWFHQNTDGLRPAAEPDEL